MKLHRRSLWFLSAMTLTAGAGILGCGGAAPPTEKVASTEAAIRGAQEVGAPAVPQAALHLKLAQEQLDKAKALMQDGDNKRAESMLLRAQADAELSLSLARESNTRAEAQTTMDQVRALRDKNK